MSRPGAWSTSGQQNRSKYQEEFYAILDALYTEAGMTRKRRLTSEEKAQIAEDKAREKAQAELVKIREEFPDLFTPGDAVAEAAEGSGEAPVG